MSEQRATIRFGNEASDIHGSITLAMQAAPPHAVLVRLEEGDEMRPAMQLDATHVRMLVTFLTDSFLNKLP